MAYFGLIGFKGSNAAHIHSRLQIKLIVGLTLIWARRLWLRRSYSSAERINSKTESMVQICMWAIARFLKTILLATRCQQTQAFIRAVVRLVDILAYTKVFPRIKF